MISIHDEVSQQIRNRGILPQYNPQKNIELKMECFPHKIKNKAWIFILSYSTLSIISKQDNQIRKGNKRHADWKGKI